MRIPEFTWFIFSLSSFSNSSIELIRSNNSLLSVLYLKWKVDYYYNDDKSQIREGNTNQFCVSSVCPC